MSRYIDADEAEKLFRAGCGYAIWELTSIDIVRCQDCKYWHKDALLCTCWNNETSTMHPNCYADDFCSYGEREK